VLHAADTRGAGFFSNPLLRNNRLHRHFGDVVLHGRSLGIHDRNPELDCLVSICLRLGDIERQCARMSELRGSALNANLVAVAALITGLIAVLMITSCVRHWIKEYSGLGKTRSTFFVSLGCVAVYYGILGRFFWEMIPTP